MKKVLSMIIAISMAMMPITVFADDENTFMDPEDNSTYIEYSEPEVTAKDEIITPTISQTSMTLGYNCEGSIQYWGFPCAGNHYYEITSSNENVIDVFEMDIWYDGKYGYDEFGRDVHTAYFYACGYGTAVITVSDGTYAKTCTVTVPDNRTVYATSYVKSFKVKKGKKSFTAKWKKQSKKNQKKFNGYQVRYSTSSDMSGAKYATASKKSKSKKIKGLGKKTTYYVQVRTYTKSSGKTLYSKWSGTKSVKTK